MRPTGHEPQNDQRRDHEQQQPKIIVREQGAEREYGSEIGNKARSQDHLAHGSIAESTLNHHRVNDGDRSGGECDASDLCLMQRPAENELREEPHDSKWNGKRKNADQHARAPIGLQRNRIDLCSGEKREHAAAEEREKVGPLRGLQYVMQVSPADTSSGKADVQRAAFQADGNVASDHANQDLN